ncbi:MAG: nucleotidyltransferase domain-containing protein [Flexistipes sp.]|uniref:DNA polymerase beta domain protein region n=2 Tax=Flexistipitaceae TaxID=2945022 RepID=F8E4C6_FLESM|nr:MULTISPECIES: nucleotidyltransferase domain-containing protein [Flexistipes]AEI15553.1 DNA polymerase beta domain protein region [Flexistipes sinusarabici DSM 4947]MEC9493302.1 nucleotidyltransferase domain-containing protein [Flexistipes sp.]
MPANQTELTKGHILECLNRHKDVLRNKFSVIKIGLFGSYVNDTYDTGSDIDIYVKFSNTNFRNVAGAWVYIEKILDHKVDLVYDHKDLNKPLKENIEKEVMYG